MNVIQMNDRNISLSSQNSNLILGLTTQSMDTKEVQNDDKISNPIPHLKPTEHLNKPQMTTENIFKKQLEFVPLDNYDAICFRMQHSVPLRQVTLINMQ